MIFCYVKTSGSAERDGDNWDVYILAGEIYRIGRC